jgi:hypothetical protein
MNRRSKSSLVREAVALLSQHGFDAVVDANSKHFKVRWLQNGRPQLLVVSRSASDRRAAVASRTLLRQLIAAESLS